MELSNFRESGGIISVDYAANTTGNDITGSFGIMGEDINGDNVNSQMVTITQLGADASITITPSSKTVSRTDYYTTFTITTSGTVNDLSMTTTDY